MPTRRTGIVRAEIHVRGEGRGALNAPGPDLWPASGKLARSKPRSGPPSYGNSDFDRASSPSAVPNAKTRSFGALTDDVRPGLLKVPWCLPIRNSRLLPGGQPRNCSKLLEGQSEHHQHEPVLERLVGL